MKAKAYEDENLYNYIEVSDLGVKKQRYKGLLTLNNKIKEEELMILCRQMAILLESGSEITKILGILISQSNKKIEQTLNKVQYHINQGYSISESFERTKLFSAFFINMMKSGEISGELDKAMYSLADYYEKEHKTKKKIKDVSIYPKIVLILAFVAMIFIMTFIIPNFEMLFISNGVTPPILTQILIDTSKTIRTKGQYIAIFITVTIPIFYYVFTNSKRIDYFKNNLKFKIPIIKNLFQLIITTRFSKTLGMLIKSGVHIVEAIDISSKVIDNDFIYNKLMISNEYIKQGNTIAYSLRKSNVFPVLFISMIKIGEESGRLEESLSTTYNFYSNNLDTKIERIMRLIEPVVIIVLGIFIGLFMLAMVMPMFDAITSI